MTKPGQQNGHCNGSQPHAGQQYGEAAGATAKPLCQQRQKGQQTGEVEKDQKDANEQSPQLRRLLYELQPHPNGTEKRLTAQGVGPLYPPPTQDDQCCRH